MKKYIKPELMVVELSIKRNLMLTGSDGNGNQILTDGGDGDGSDIEVKQHNSVWNNQW